jgi:uncharacterized membrane protein YedE/YeeE
MRNLISLLVGFIFALGLGLSGMTQVHVVRGFLDITGDWNLNLMGVMIGAICIHALLFFLIKKRSSPILDTRFHLPTKKDLDFHLISGAALFGIGWGWAGICPGPGLVASVSGNVNIIIFVVSMIGGMMIFKILGPKIRR